MKLTQKNIMIIIAALIVAGGAYWYFFTGTGNEPPISTTSGTSSEARVRFQTLVGQLSPISFDTQIFSDPRFQSLTSIETTIAPEPVGR